jgi:hypothetical protein
MAINTQTHPKLLWPGIQDLWGDYFYGEHESEYDKIFEVADSNKAYEEDVQITGFGLAPEKAQGGSLSYDTEHQGFIQRYTHVAYALGYVVTHEELQDNLYMEVASRRAKGVAFSMNQTIETVAANILNRAVNASYTFADGKTLLATDHPNTTGGTWSNKLATAADLSQTSIEDLSIQMMGATNDRGLQIPLMGQCLIVPRQELFNAQRILNSTLQSGTANNDVNVLKGYFPDGVVMNHYLDDTDQWFIKSNAPNGMKFLWRERPSFSNDGDFDTMNVKHAGYMRFKAGVTDPRGIYGTEGAA